MNSSFSGESAHRAYLQLEQTLESNHLDESIIRLKDFLRHYPDFDQAHNDLAVLYYRAGNTLQTLGHYEKAVKLNPLNSTFRKNLASFYFVEMAWVDEAIFIYTDLLAKNPDDSEVLTALGIISRNLDRTAEALTFFGRLLELEPWNHEVRNLLAELEDPAGTSTVASAEDIARFSTGCQDIVQAGLQSPASNLEQTNHPAGLYEKARHLLTRGDEQGAILELLKLVQSQPANALVHNELGVLYHRHGELAKAVHHHELAVKEAPDNATYKKNLAGLYFAELGRTDEAIFLLTETLRSNPDDVEILTGLARIALAIGRQNEASTFIRKVTELEPWNEEAREFLSQTQDSAGFFLTK